MRDTLALALVRAERCRVHAIGQRRLPVSGQPGPVIATTIQATRRIPFVRNRGTRHHTIGASDNSPPPD